MTPPQVERAILEGLGYRDADVTRSARRQLEAATRELVAVRGLDLAVLRRSSELWGREGFERPLRVRDVATAYPLLAAAHRRLRKREERQEREERELWASLGHTPNWLPASSSP